MARRFQTVWWVTHFYSLSIKSLNNRLDNSYLLVCRRWKIYLDSQQILVFNTVQLCEGLKNAMTNPVDLFYIISDMSPRWPHEIQAGCWLRAQRNPRGENHTGFLHVTPQSASQPSSKPQSWRWRTLAGSLMPVWGPSSTCCCAGRAASINCCTGSSSSSLCSTTSSVLFTGIVSETTLSSSASQKPDFKLGFLFLLFFNQGEGMFNMLKTHYMKI